MSLAKYKAQKAADSDPIYGEPAQGAAAPMAPYAAKPIGAQVAENEVPPPPPKPRLVDPEKVKRFKFGAM